MHGSFIIWRYKAILGDYSDDSRGRKLVAGEFSLGVI